MNNAVNQAGFAFVQSLAADLNRGKVQVPSFPDVVIRIKRVLEGDNCDTERLTRVIATEPALAARLLSIANSALIQRGGKSVQDLRTAINRLGHEMVRTTAMSVAVEQIFLGSSLGAQKTILRRIFQESTRIAALSYVLARKLTKLNPDEALMAGLLHNVGKLYILARVSDHEKFFEGDEILESVVRDWHGQIGRAIIESWGFSEDMAAAAGEHMDLLRSPSGPPNLTDLVTVAWMISQPAANEELEFKKVRAWTRLQLDDEQRAAAMRESQADIKALAAALGG